MIECDEPSNKGGNAVQCTGCMASSRVHFSCKEDGRIFAADAWNARLNLRLGDEMMNATEKVMAAAEALNRDNAMRAQIRAQLCSSADILYRDHMVTLQRVLDEAFQEYYAAKIPPTSALDK